MHIERFNLIVSIDDKSVEIQVRTKLQHRWAEVSEKGADLLDRAVKYGGGRLISARHSTTYAE